MHNIEDDIDKMFQDAAEGYPLRTSGEDWDKVSAGLVSTPSYFWRSITALAVLLLLSTLIISIIGQIDKAEVQLTATNTSTLLEKENGVASSPAIKNNLILDDNIEANLNNRKPTNSSKASSRLIYNTKAKASVTLSTFPSFASLLPSNARAVNKAPEVKGKQDIKIENIFYSNNYTATKTQSGVAGTENQVFIKDLPAINTNTGITSISTNHSNRRIYFGGGIGLSSSWVKDQKWSNPTPSVNVFAGKKIGKKLAVEAGLGYEEITYYTTGEYFNPKKSDMPSNMEVRSLSSSCAALTIPIELKYDIATRAKKIYIKAGVGNRLMLREKNTYDALMSGVPEEVKASYNDAKFQPLSDIRIAVGVGIPVGKKNSLSVEPYLRLPTKGLGVGNVSVMQGGLQVIFRRK